MPEPRWRPACSLNLFNLALFLVDDYYSVEVIERRACFVVPSKEVYFFVYAYHLLKDSSGNRLIGCQLMPDTVLHLVQVEFVVNLLNLKVYASVQDQAFVESDQRSRLSRARWLFAWVLLPLLRVKIIPPHRVGALMVLGAASEYEHLMACHLAAMRMQVRGHCCAGLYSFPCKIVQMDLMEVVLFFDGDFGETIIPAPDVHIPAPAHC